jgi:predicted small lipoprotein YifL
LPALIARFERLSTDPIRPTGERTMKPRTTYLAALTLSAAAALAGCTQMGPVEFSTTGADAPMNTASDDLDFGPMDHSIAACKVESKNSGTGRCAQVRAYEACMKTRGYITVLGPENPSGCGDPAWEQDVRKWLR